MNINTMNMKKYIAALFGAIALVASGCADYDSDIKRLERRIDEIESNQIKSIESQIKTSMSHFRNWNRPTRISRV